MRRYSRSEFLSLSAMLAGAVGLDRLPFGSRATRPCAADAAGEGCGDFEADLIVTGGRVLTMDATAQTAQAFAVKAGKFVAIGSNATCATSPRATRR